MRKIATTLALALGLLAPALPSGAADNTPLRMLQTGDDSRGWEAVGRLNLGKAGFCTGALIAPDLVLTAAHCMFHRDTGQRFEASEIQFLAGFRGGRANAYRGVKRAFVHPGFENSAEENALRVAHDLALLELDQPIRLSGVQPFETAEHPRKGDAVGVVSYAHDRAEAPSLQEACHVLARQSGTLVMSCSVDFGSSGAPVFMIEGGRARIVSVISAKAMVRDIPVALGMSLEKPLAELMAMRANGDGVFTRSAPTVRRLGREGSNGSTGAKFLRPAN